MITLYTTPPLWGLPSISPACMKLDANQCSNLCQHYERMTQLFFSELALLQREKSLAPLN